MPKKAIEFMNTLLKIDPKDRLTALDALKHTYFKGLNDEFLNPNQSKATKKGQPNQLVSTQNLPFNVTHHLYFV